MPTQKIAMVIHEGVQALDVAGPADVFAEANRFIPAEDAYVLVLVAGTLAPLRTSNGTRILADRSFAETQDDDHAVVLVAGGPTLPNAEHDPTLSAWLRAQAARGGAIGSVCNGAFQLGHAGLLDGRRVTTHWEDAKRLAALFPAAQVEEDRIFIQDGDLVTSAGVTAGIDLALAMVGRRQGADIALAVAKRLVVVAQRQGGQSQFSPLLVAPPDPSSPVDRAQARLLAELEAGLSVKALALSIGVSARSLSRLFLADTGITPLEFITRARIDRARNLLEGGDRPLKAIAYACGFGTADRMRRVFERRLGLSPSQYRQQFRAP